MAPIKYLTMTLSFDFEDMAYNGSLTDFSVFFIMSCQVFLFGKYSEKWFPIAIA